jgi:cytochrome c peroxidase
MKMCTGILVLFCSGLMAVGNANLTVVELELPQGWPAPTYDLTASPLTKEGIALGRRLFYDPILSHDSTISCSNCHLSFTAFTHVDHALSHGIRDSIGARNSPALMNLAWGRSFMWDGAVNHLDMQALAPITHAAEMGESLPNVLIKLQRSSSYPKSFGTVFGDTIITGEDLLKALAQFQLTLISSNSKYDKVKRGEAGFSDQESKGYVLFRANCSTCHKEPLFTSGEFANNGLPVDVKLADNGRMKVTGIASDSLKFKVPTLRNIEFSYPYMHDGRFKTLRQVLDHYDTGIRSSATLASELTNGIQLTSDQKSDVIAFLLTLTDQEFLFNPENSYPKY